MNFLTPHVPYSARPFAPRPSTCVPACIPPHPSQRPSRPPRTPRPRPRAGFVVVSNAAKLPVDPLYVRLWQWTKPLTLPVWLVICASNFAVGVFMYWRVVHDVISFA